jgi:hypothetical protein
MRGILIGTLSILLCAVEVAAALPKSLTASQLVELCKSSTVSDAVEKGDQLGWRKMNDADLNEWRTSFISYNGGSVDVVGWKRGEGEGDGTVAFWIAQGPNGHKACMYSVGESTGLLDDLSALLGTPQTFDKLEFGAVASWKTDSMEASFSQVSSSATVSISYQN